MQEKRCLELSYPMHRQVFIYIPGMFPVIFSYYLNSSDMTVHVIFKKENGPVYGIFKRDNGRKVVKDGYYLVALHYCHRDTAAYILHKTGEHL